MPRDYGPYDDELERTVFVNGLAYESTETDVRYFFEECGEIERINLPRYQNSDRNIGYCHVRFARRRYARRALRKSGQYLDKRYLKIEMAQDMRSRNSYGGRGRDRSRDRDGYRSGGYGDRYSRRSYGSGGYGRSHRRDYDRGDRGSTSTIFIKNLPYDSNEDEVADFFEDCGDVKSVRLIYNAGKSHFKGYGYVDFQETESTKKAMKLNGTDFNGRPIYIDLEYRKPKDGYGKEWGGKRSRSRSNSRGRRVRRSRSRSRDKLYRHTRGEENDGEFNKPSHYYNKVYNKQEKSSRRSNSHSKSRSRRSRTSSSRSARSHSSSKSKGSGSQKVNLDLKTSTTGQESNTGFNIANTLDPRKQTMAETAE